MRWMVVSQVGKVVAKLNRIALDYVSASGHIALSTEGLCTHAAMRQAHPETVNLLRLLFDAAVPPVPFLHQVPLYICLRLIISPFTSCSRRARRRPKSATGVGKPAQTARKG